MMWNGGNYMCCTHRWVALAVRWKSKRRMSTLQSLDLNLMSRFVPWNKCQMTNTEINWLSYMIYTYIFCIYIFLYITDILQYTCYWSNKYRINRINNFPVVSLKFVYFHTADKTNTKWQKYRNQYTCVFMQSARVEGNPWVLYSEERYQKFLVFLEEVLPHINCIHIQYPVLMK